MIPAASSPDAVLFYDGLCGLCDRLVRFILDHDPDGAIRFASIQSAAGRALLLSHGASGSELAGLSTVFFLRKGVLHRRSRAVFGVFSLLPPPWKMLGLFQFLPAFPADLVYHAVSRTRYRWFGRFDQCRIPSPSEKARFLE